MTYSPDISLRSISIAFDVAGGGQKRIVEDVSLEVHPGEIVSIVGPSGCGKTSILRAIIGEIKYDGYCELHRDRECEISYLHQAPTLLPWRTALENAALGQEVRGRMSIDSLRRVEDLLIDFGLKEDELSYYPDQLSGGMKQRVTIARALESSPKILLCDEPFSAIDYINRLKLNQIFKQRCASKVSVLLVTHNIDEAIFLSNKIYVMAGTPGRIVKIISPVFADHVTTPISLREQPEFEEYFKLVWQKMECASNV